MKPQRLRVLIILGEVAYTAVCLENFIVSQGKTAEEAYENWKRTLRGTVLLTDSMPGAVTPLSDPKPAPKEYFDKWTVGSRTCEILVYNGKQFNVFRQNI